jgi:uncharacterized membrane protein YedE/YeeE
MDGTAEALSAKNLVEIEPRRARDARVAGVAILLLALGAIYLGVSIHWRQASLFLVGGAMGVALYHASFGFTGAWRDFLFDGRGGGLRAHMLLLGLTSILFLPALAQGKLFGSAVSGAVAPVGISVIAGAFLFGVGMQLGGG